ncbi:unnamed protein product (mitochondrion) [Plasmodiophora brassicae]|uniref:Acyltransferase n=1 Tax=Plasmodiophora brassicae TaxID=37360 RepID=A0A3P3Y918_PLABS|nr:unnamed protein product [Plasmodiophora brassicae]
MCLQSARNWHCGLRPPVRAGCRRPLSALGILALDMPFMGLRWAPLAVPMERRLQTLAVLVTMLPFLVFPVLTVVCLRSWPVVAPLFTLYCVYIALFQTYQFRGSIRQDWVRRSRFWVYFASFFPVRLVKTADLPPDRPYIFGIHPHGIIGVSAFANFGTEGTGFSKQFPGIVPHLLTISFNFRMPFMGLLLGAHGVCDASRRTCRNILRRGAGQSIAIVVGGAKEALDARPGTCILTLANRKGFIKMAIEHGACLVPVFSFGETDIYDQVNNPRGSRLREWQDSLLRVFGFSMPLIKGRGVFNYDFGILPRRHPIWTVIGAPIEVKKVAVESIDSATIDAVHEQYVKSLQELYDQFKERYAASPDADMRLMQ